MASSTFAPNEPVPIDYYTCMNSGVGIIIYPQLRRADSPSAQPIWDGRNQSGFQYMITVGNRCVVNLADIGITEGTKFLLSSNTVFGPDVICENQVFEYKPGVHSAATAARTGGVGGGELCWEGCRPYGPADFRFDFAVSRSHGQALHSQQSFIPAVAVELMVERLGGFGFPGGHALWRGIVRWANAGSITAGISTMVFYFNHHGYQIEYSTEDSTHKTTFKLGTQGSKLGAIKGGTGAAEKKVQDVKADWEEALKEVARYAPKDLGLTELHQ